MNPLSDSADARTIALIALAVTLVVVAVLAVRAWRRSRQLLTAMGAANALVTTHSDVVAQKVERLAARAEAEHGNAAALAVALRNAGQDVRELRYLLGLLPNEKDKLERAAIDFVLPTDDAR